MGRAPWVVVLSSVVVVGCTNAHPVGGELAGYEAALGALSLSLNGGDALALPGDGAFTFPRGVDENKPWTVTLVESPVEQQCTLDGATGTMGRTAVDSVRVACVTKTYVLGGTATGVDRDGVEVTERVSGQVLRVASGADSFFFAAPIAFGRAYEVTVTSTPPGRDCVLAAATGTIAGTTRSLALSCTVRHLPLTVTLQGVDADGLVLSEQGSSQTLSPGAGMASATFTAPLAWEAAWDVRITAAPEGRDCSVDGGTGVVLGPIASPTVTCALQRFSVGGVVSGLDGGTLGLTEALTQQSLSLDAGAASFVFANPIAWGSSIDVSVASQPQTLFCTLDGGVRLVRAPVTDLAVNCRAGFPVSGEIVNLRGAGLELTERGTRQVLAPDAGTFTLPFVVPENDPLRLEVSAHPSGQTCRLDGAGGVMTGPRQVRVVCGPQQSHLALNEFGSVPSVLTPFWVELYNGTRQPVAAAEYVLRAATLNINDAGLGAPLDFQLPDASIPVGGYLVVSSKQLADLHDSAQQRFLLQGELTPTPGAGLELLQAGAPIDAVSFDGGLPQGAMDLGRSLARQQVPDSDTAADFSTCDFPTPGGLNDVCSSPDVDNDGLPDVAEVANTTWDEQPLFDWGARTGRRDVFIEVDWLDPAGFNGTLDYGVLPRREALARVQSVFDAHGISVHFDSGALFHPAAGVSAVDFDLGGGNQTSFACTITLSNVAGATSLYAVKAANTDLRRRLSFHYALFASSLADVVCSNSGAGATGNSELGGNDLVVSLGRSGLLINTTQNLNRTINWQAATLMHELGHNLGLRHGGFEDGNYKPNYVSVMNYLYQLDGLPIIGTNEGDRYLRAYVAFNVCSGAPGITSVNGLSRNRFSDPAQFGLEYSDGTSVDLNEAALNESAGLGRTGSGSIDWNWSGSIETATVTANVNGLAQGPAVCPRNSSGNEVLRDFNDWAALSLPFARTARGASGKLGGRLDAMGDHQEVADEAPVPRD